MTHEWKLPSWLEKKMFSKGQKVTIWWVEELDDILWVESSSCLPLSLAVWILLFVCSYSKNRGLDILHMFCCMMCSMCNAPYVHGLSAANSTCNLVTLVKYIVKKRTRAWVMKLAVGYMPSVKCGVRRTGEQLRPGPLLETGQFPCSPPDQVASPLARSRTRGLPCQTVSRKPHTLVPKHKFDNVVHITGMSDSEQMFIPKYGG